MRAHCTCLTGYEVQGQGDAVASIVINTPSVQRDVVARLPNGDILIRGSPRANIFRGPLPSLALSSLKTAEVAASYLSGDGERTKVLTYHLSIFVSRTVPATLQAFTA